MLKSAIISILVIWAVELVVIVAVVAFTLLKSRSDREVAQGGAKDTEAPPDDAHRTGAPLQDAHGGEAPLDS